MHNTRLAGFQGESHVGKPRLNNTLCFVDYAMVRMQHHKVISIADQLRLFPLIFTMTVVHCCLQTMESDICKKRRHDTPLWCTTRCCGEYSVSHDTSFEPCLDSTPHRRVCSDFV